MNKKDNWIYKWYDINTSTTGMGNDKELVGDAVVGRAGHLFHLLRVLLQPLLRWPREQSNGIAEMGNGNAF